MKVDAIILNYLIPPQLGLIKLKVDVIYAVLLIIDFYP